MTQQKETIQQNNTIERRRLAEAADIITDAQAIKRLTKPELIAQIAKYRVLEICLPPDTELTTNQKHKEALEHAMLLVEA